MAREPYEDVDEPRKDQLAGGIVIMTTLVLLAAIFVIQKALSEHYQAGMLAPKTTAGGPPR